MMPTEGGQEMTTVNGTTDGSTEETELVQKDSSTDEGQKLRIGALCISYLSVIGLFILGLVVLIFSIMTDNSSGFAFTLDAWLDCLSSSVVIWRFTGAAKLHSHSRERVAAIILGALFIVSTFVILAKAGVSISMMIVPQKSEVLFGLSIFNGFFCFGLAVGKVYLGKRLDSISLMTDAVNSFIGMLLAFSTVISEAVYDHNPDIWYLDSTVAIIAAFFLLGYGIWLIVSEVNTNEGEEGEEATEDNTATTGTTTVTDTTTP